MRDYQHVVGDTIIFMEGEYVRRGIVKARTTDYYGKPAYWVRYTVPTDDMGEVTLVDEAHIVPDRMKGGTAG